MRFSPLLYRGLKYQFVLDEDGIDGYFIHYWSEKSNLARSTERSMQMFRNLPRLVLVTAIVGGSLAQAAVPKLLNYQGRLTDGSGNPVADGGHTITFRIWSDSTAGAALWSESQTVTTKSGLFSAILGISTGNQVPDSIFMDLSPVESRWLGIQILPDPEMTPRQRIVSVGYAYRSDRVTTVDRATGGSISGSLSFGSGASPMLYIYESGTSNPNRPVISHSPSYPDWGLSYDDTYDRMTFQGAGLPAMTVNLYPGMVGIGTTSPLYLLDVVDSSASTAGRFANKGLNGYGLTASSNWWGDGIYSTSNLGNGVSGINTGGSGAGVYANGSSTGIYAVGGSYAGVFGGNVSVIGTLSKLAGSFKIDHPLDPENKFLYHSFVESPDMKNIYDGIATLDAGGTATVTLPDWFEALNQDFRYQLTAVGAPGPNLYISREVAGNQFSIAGGTPGMRVSWMVTGIRHDAYASAHRIPVEETKTAKDRGLYLDPQSFGQPENKRIKVLETAETKR